MFKLAHYVFQTSEGDLMAPVLTGSRVLVVLHPEALKVQCVGDMRVC